LVFLIAAALLSLERICYVWVWRFPEAFRRLCHGLFRGVLVEPVAAIRRSFYGFKFLQIMVFAGWFYIYGHGSLWPASGSLPIVAVGLVLIVIGQILNVGVFFRLGNNGVFYGNRFGLRIPWVNAFPFSLLSHPQYVGAVVSIWGLFIAIQFPRSGWYLLPSLETSYYFLGALLEQ
jgi:methylene-fatty-acyl-phospholipid synthase